MSAPDRLLAAIDELTSALKDTGEDLARFDDAVEHREYLQLIAGLLGGLFPGLGFVLLVTEFGDIPVGRVDFISNGQRPEVIQCMRDGIAQLEQGKDWRALRKRKRPTLTMLQSLPLKGRIKPKPEKE